jgi:transcription initiation factor TFIID subunit TAF12
LSTQVDTLSEQNTSLSTQVSTLTQDKSEKDHIYSDLEKKLQNTVGLQQNYDLQLRLNAMQIADVKNLQAQLEDSEHKRRQQTDLLQQLTSRLSQAADELRHLQMARESSLKKAPKPATSGRRVLPNKAAD